MNIRSSNTGLRYKFFLLAFLSFLTINNSAFAFDSKNDGLYKIDMEATANSEYFKKFLKKNPMGEMGLQVASQILEYIRIKKDVMLIFSTECKLRQDGDVIKGDCYDRITEKKAPQLEILLDGNALTLLENDYPMFYRKQ